MKRSTETIISLVALCLVGCVQGTASDTFSKTETLSFPPEPGVPVNVDITVSQSTTFDISSPVSSLQKIGTVSLSFPVNSISDDNLSFVHHVRVSVTPTDNSMPEMFISDYSVPSSTTNVINVPVVADGVALANYFGHGPVSLRFWLNGSAAGYPTGGITVTHVVEANASITLDKSVSNIGH